MSFSDLVKKANKEKEEEKKKQSSFGTLVEEAYSGKSNVASNVSGSKVGSWSKSTQGVLKKAYDFLSADGYRAADTSLIGEMDGYLSEANDVLQYLRANKNSISDYEKVYASYVDLNNALRSFQEDVNRKNNYLSQFSSEEDYQSYKEYLARQEELKKMAESEQGATGWQKYLDDVAKAEERKKQAREDEKWWETLGRHLGPTGPADTTLSPISYAQLVDDVSKDTSLGKPKDDWTEEQKRIYGYLYATSHSKASQYARETNEYNNLVAEEEALKKIAELATSNFWAGAGNTIGAIVTAPLGLADYLDDLVQMNATGTISTDGNISPFEYSQAVTSGISSHLNEKYGTLDDDTFLIGGKGLGDVYGLGTSIAQSMASAYALGPGVTLISYFGQGAASGVDEALSRGATEEQAILYGTALGAFEAIAEEIGVEHLFKLGSSATIKGFLKNILSQAGAEGMEEGLTALLSNIADNAIMQDKSNFNFLVAQYMASGMSESEAKKKAWLDSVEGIAFDTIAGAVSGGISGGVHTSVNNISSNIDAKKIYGDGASLVTEALDIDPNNVYAQQMQEKVEKGKELSGGQINRLVEVNEQTLRTQDTAKMKSAVEARLTQLGETGDTSKLADVIVKAQSGGKLTTAERNVLVNSKYGRRVSTELNPQSIKSGEYSSTWAENIGTERINTEAYNKQLYDLAVERSGGEVGEKNVSVTESTPIDKIATEGKLEVSADGKTKIGDTEVSIKEIASIKDGEMTLRLEDGSTVNANDVEYGSSAEALLYENVVDLGLNAETANAFIRGYNPSEGLTAKEYALGFREAYRYGEYGYPVQEMSGNGFSARLSEAQKGLAYNLGKTDAKYKAAEKQSQKAKIASTDTINADKDANKGKKKGKVHYDVDTKALTDRQKTSLKGLETIADALGVEFYLFESEVGADGKRKGANGWFDPKDGSIHIDIHAGLNGEGTMLFTAAHELTHFIREWSPAKFKVFADFLLEQYGQKGISVDALVRNQIEKAKRNGRDISFDTAYEEVVADSCEAMLADGDVMQKLAELKAKDKTLWAKIKDFIADLVAKIKAVYEGLSPDSVEGRYVAEMLDSAEKLKALWTEALVDAGENFSSAEQTLAENGIAVDPATDSASLYSVRDVLTDEQRQKVASALATRFDVTPKEAMDWLKAETSMASLILNPKYSQYLDYTADPNEVAIKQNSDYPQGTVDFSPICAKRREFTSVMNNILRVFPNHVFAATDLAKIRSIMQEEGMTIPCGICYVEDRRQLDTIVAQNFIDSLKLYREGSKTRPDGKAFNTNQLKGLSLTDGDAYTPSVYELVSLEGLNVLKAKNPNMAEAWVKFNNARGMQSVRLLANEAEYKRQILKYSKQTVKSKNDKGGLRVYSFSDAEMFHLIDIIQVIADSATVGLSLQGYTKVNEYARTVKDTGEKLNRSLIPKGELGYHLENGKVVLDYDTVEGIDINHPDFFDNKDNPDVGNITIGVSDVQIRAAMVSDFVDQIIPFHTGQSEEVLGEKGIATWTNYKDFQTEKDIATGKVSDHQINIYTEVLQVLENEGKPITKRTFVEKFLQVCKENNLTPRFSQFLNTNEKGEYVYTEGYHKMLVDFKTFAQTEVGEYLPQKPVKPIFDNEYITKILKDYVKSQKVKDADLAKSMPKVIERITNEIVKPGETKLSDRDTAPTFYSHMGKVVDGIKSEKVGAGGVVPYLKGKGVKNEEIKWSGIEAFLEGKKSVTKAELQEFIAGSQLAIEEEMSGLNQEVYDELNALWEQHMGVPLSETFSDDFDFPLTEENVRESLLWAKKEGYDVPPEEVQLHMIDLAKKAGNEGRWASYKLGGGTHYRELVFKMPNSSYSNDAMRAHWGDDAEGVLAHARIQDMTTADGKKMLFVEEIQSDWHNEGAKKGYDDNELFEKQKALKQKAHETFLKLEDYSVAATGLAGEWETIERTPRGAKLLREYREAQAELEKVSDAYIRAIPDAPFRSNYHEYVLKRLIRMAAEEGYDSIGWTTAEIQSQRWSSDYAEGYRIEYDQDIPSFLKKYGKKWGAKVGNTFVGGDSIESLQNAELAAQAEMLDAEEKLAEARKSGDEDLIYNLEFAYRIAKDKYSIALRNSLNGNQGTKVWSMSIPESMKNSVLHEGQVMYSDRVIPTGIELPEGTKVDKNGKPRSAQAQRDAGYMLNETKFNQLYSAHKIDIGKRWGDVHAQIESIKAEGFKGGSGTINTLPVGISNIRMYNGEPIFDDIIQKAYAPKKGEYILLVPKNWVNKTGKVIEGFKPLDYEVVQAERDYQPYYELYEKAYKEREGQVKYSDRDPDSFSNRSLLANALESVAQNDVERNKLKQYKEKIALIESEQAKLAETRAKIKELSFAKGKRDTEAIKQLQFEANQSANRINTYDRQLLNLESTKALKGVLEREKQMAYKKAEREGKEALAKYRERAAETQRELLTRYQESRAKGVEGRRKTEMRHKIKNVVNELNQYLLRGTKEKHVPIELQKAVAEALEAVNMDTVGAEERIAKLEAELVKAKTPEAIQEISRKIDHIREMGERMDGKLQKLKDAYDDIVNSNDPLVANSHDEVISNSIARVIKEVGSTPLRDMTLSQLEDVYDMYRMVLTTIRNTNKAFKAKKNEEISVIANRVMEEIDKVGKKKLYRTKAEQFVSQFDWNNLKPVYAFERIGSDTFTEVFNNVRAGEDTWAVDITEAKEFSEEQRNKFKHDSWDFKKRFTFTSTSGMQFELSLEQIMSLYAYSKREQAKDHLKKGGIVFDETTEVTIKTKLGIPVKFNPTQATAYNLSDETLADIISKLTPEQRAFVDVMQEYLSTTMGEKGNEVSLELYGVKLFKEKFYFPLKSATQFMAKAKEQQQGEVKVKNSGFSKETTPKASNPIVLTPFMDVWAGHVNEMSMYHAFVLPLEDFYRVFNYKTPTSDTMATESVEMFLQNAYGKAASQYIDQLLKDLNGGARVDPTAGIINKLTGLFKKSAVFASASVVVQQPSAIARATALVDTKYFVGKPAKGKHSEVWAEVKRYAPVAIIKEMGYFDTGMGQSTVEWIKDEKTWKDKVDDIASKAPALADEYSWCIIWNAVKRETLHTHKDLKPNSEEFLKAVGERFTEVIVKTQVYDSVLSRSANMRSKDTGMKMATAFMAEPTTSINMLENALIQGKRGNKTDARKAVGAVVASMILNSILVSFVYAGRDDDEDKTYTEKYIGTLTEELLDSFNPLTLIPFVKDIVSIVQGYDVERSDMAVITDLVKAWKNLGKDNRTAYRKVEDFAGAIASIFGLPVKNLMRDARAMYNTVNSFINGEKTTGQGIKDAITEGVTGKEKSNGQQLYEAILSGDTTQIERVKGRFKDQNAINSAIRTALRENDSRIKEAAQARINGDIAGYTRIAKAIIGEGHFSQDDVVAAINAEINALKKGDGTSSSTSSDSNKVTSIYKMDDYFTALVSSDQATAYAVREDIIKTDVANGKDRDEAESDFNGRFTSHLRERYEAGELSDYEAEKMLVEYAGKTEDEAYSKVQYWGFKTQYPDYDMSEEAVKKYYADVEPSGIDVSVYYDYTKQRAKCKGTDADGDGRTDSGSVKAEVLYVIDSLPITYEQKDVLYYLNGWSASTIWEAPWH